MLNNYYTLLHICSEINDKVAGTKLIKAFTRRKGTLEVTLEGLQGDKVKLVVSCIPQQNFIYAEDAGGRRESGANVFPDIVDKEVQTLSLVENEREVLLQFSDGTSLVLDLFGPAANVYYIDKDRLVLDSFLRPNDNDGRSLNAAPARGKAFPENAVSLKYNLSQLDGSVFRKLPKMVPGFDSFLSREVLFRYGRMVNLSESADLTKIDIESTQHYEVLFGVLANIRAELLAPSPRIYSANGKPIAFGLIRLEQLGEETFETRSSVNSCVRDFVVTFDKASSIFSARRSVSAKLVGRLDFLGRTLSKIEEDISSNRSNRYRATAEWLMANMNSVRRGIESIEIISADGAFQARLDPALTPIQNAQAYFERSKRARKSLKLAFERKSQLVKETEQVKILIQQVDASSDIKFLNSVTKTVIKDEDERLPFRVFEFNRYKIYVGKDAKSNDQLTFGFARPNDVFLHARGVSGSHVIIRNPSRNYPEKQVIEYAAKVAAHYSKARSSAIVPVAYTMRKFLKKAKGIPGAVVLNREEVVFVDSADWTR